MRVAVVTEAARRGPLVDAGSGVRRFAQDDVPQVADLHRRVFGTFSSSATGWLDSYRKYFSEVFPEAAPHGEAFGSLVYEDHPGSIAGFLGMHPRRMVFEQRPLLMAVCSQFAVDPARRGPVGLRMLKQGLQGPQDLSLTDEAGDDTRRVWEWCGGKAALLYSIHWIRPLRLARTGVALFLRRDSPTLARLSTPLAWIADALLGRLAPRPIGAPVPHGSGEDLDEPTLSALLPEFTGDRSLRPDYGDGSLGWILRRASTRRAGGEFRKVLVRDDRQNIAGWYIYFANRGGIGEVLQIIARGSMVGPVLDHLIHDAWQRGLVALSGRVDPAYAQALSERFCLFYRLGHWTLIHSRDRELQHAIEKGDALLTRLEGEWCLRFQ